MLAIPRKLIMPSIYEIQRSLAESSLGLFAMTYEDALKKNGMKHGPRTGAELMEMMRDVVFDRDLKEDELCEEEYVINEPKKENKKEEMRTTVIVPVEVAAPVPAIVSAPATEPVTTEPALLDTKEVKKLLKTFKIGDVSMELPYVPKCIDYTSGCQCLSVNGGLLTPCMTRPKTGEKYCTSCTKKGSIAEEGTYQDRLNLPENTVYKTPASGKKKQKMAITYGTYCAKRGVTREEVEAWFAEHAPTIIVPETEWIVDSKKAKRVIKNGNSDDEKSVDGEEAPKKRRNKKTKAPVTPSTSSDEEEESAPVAAPVAAPVVEPVAAPVAEPVAEQANYRVIKSKEGFDMIELVENEGNSSEWTDLFTGYIRIKGESSKFYSYDEDGNLYKITGATAPVIIDVEDFTECGSWNSETETYTMDTVGEE